ncbi:cation diffusion facilitator family transporter [Geotalea uraniireducens]|uniref:Cation diffusion facilitator family transporter n=1 Tax=Geotalea uraniireducens (strain Rf4) TaxID=351605 RepID=A5G751_GEOUR|nr:cation diffusion facilitator family transporter [Geotalea uraniireducens]ABQ27619.1 cation diffusion facilitator family transporter [Geotalea uraniireducens Rf4]
MDRSSHYCAATAGLRLAFLLNLCFTLLELFGGLWTNSIAIISNAVHDLGDCLSLGLAWYLAGYAEKESDRRYSYGYRRFSLLGALATALVLMVGSLLVLSEAVPRLLRPEHPNAGGMALLAVVGIAVNGLALLRVRGGRTLNARIVTWHLLGDLLGWAAVLSVSSVLLFKDLPLLDPILSILITSYVLFNVSRNLKKTVQLFLQAVPGGIDTGEIEKKLLAIDKVKSVHHTHVWSLDGEHNVLTTHLVVEADATRKDVLKIRNRVRLLLENADFEHTTVEIGYENEYCRMKER